MTEGKQTYRDVSEGEDSDRLWAYGDNPTSCALGAHVQQGDEPHR